MIDHLYLFSPSTVQYGGHEYNQVLGFCKAARKLGLKPEVLIHKRASPEVVNSLNARPIFSHSSYETTWQGWSDGSFRLAWLQRRLARKFALACRRALGDRVLPNSLIYVDAASEYILKGLALWLNEAPATDRPRVCTFLTSRAMLQSTSDLPGKLATSFRSAIRALENAVGSENLLLTGAISQFMNDPRSAVLGTTIASFPLPKYYGNGQPDDYLQTEEPNAIRISFLGQVDERKNSSLIPDIINGVNCKLKRVKFHVQCYAKGNYAVRLRDDIIGRLSKIENVTFSIHDLSPDEYFSLLQNSDLVVLPYNSQKYRYITSGILADAIAHGVPVIVPEDTWSAAALSSSGAGGGTFRNDSVEAITKSICNSVARFSELRVRSQNAAPEWRKQQSVEAYLDKLIDWRS